jgi:CDP-diacylglycerol--serine O-phosphatidyltransferase
MARVPRRRASSEPGAERPWKRRKPSAVDPTYAEAPSTGTGRRLRAKDLLPNAFTTAALFSGFYAIVQAMGGQFNTAVYAVFAAMILDSLDGRVARMTNTQSDFGAEYDSLADMVSFGAAPALIMYQWSLQGLGRWGWAAAFIYVAGAALRLARFNTNLAVVDKRYFQGIPSPAAAALVVGFVWVFDDLRYIGSDLAWPSWVVTVYAGLTMVSNSPFFSFKVIDVKKSMPSIVLVLMMLVFALVSSDPPKWLFGMFVLYGLSGHALWLWRRARRSPARPVA